MPAVHPSLVAPVRGEHYAALDRLSDLIAPPYDVISPDARQDLAGKSPHNIVHLILPAGADPYATARRLLRDWRDTGVLVREPRDIVCVLRQEFSTPDGRSFARTGLLAGVAAEPYSAGRVRPHEKTHAGPKADRLALLRSTGTVFESLFFLARDQQGELRAALHSVTAAAPAATAVLNGVRSTLWQVADGNAARLARLAGDTLYIADGHHRFETAGAYRQEQPGADRTVGLIVPLGDPGLVVLATHRLVAGADIPAEAVASALRSHFVLEPVEAELSPHALLQSLDRTVTSCIIALRNGAVLMARLRAEADLTALGKGPASRLDVARIDRLVVAPLLELAGSGSTLGYSADPAEVFRSRPAAGVLLNPTKVEDVLAVADAGQVMPQKSTYFIPKVPSGLLLLPVA